MTTKANKSVIDSASIGLNTNGYTLTLNSNLSVSGGGNLSITSAKTATVQNTLTLSGFDGSSLAIGSGSAKALTLDGTSGATLNIGGGGTLGTGAYATIANYQALLVSGTNIRTVNGSTLLGSTDLVVPSWLVATPIKTGAYNAVNRDLVRVNSQAGSLTVTLPATPADGDLIGVVDITSSCNTYAVLVAPNGKTIEGDAVGLSINIAGATVVLSYNSASNNWKIVDTPTSFTSLMPSQTGNSGKFLSTNGSSIAWDASIVKSAAGAVQVTSALTETRTAIGASAIDLAVSNYFTKTISGSTTFTVSNVPAVGTVGAFVLELTNGGSSTVVWFSGVKWPGGTAPTLTASGVDIISFYTHDGGTTWRGQLIAKDSK